MRINTISSPANSLLKKIRGLQERSLRKKEGLFLLEGMRPVEEAVARNFPLDKIVVSSSFLEQAENQLANLNLNELSVTDDRTFKELHGTSSSCGIVAIAHTPTHNPSDLFKKVNPLIIVCDGVRDPGNLGTIMRSAFAADASGMLLTRGCVDPFNPKVVRSAVGALFDMPLLHDLDDADCLELLKQQDIPAWFADASARVRYFEADLRGPVALVFGNEAQGISDTFVQYCAHSLCIPMRTGSESLNVAVCAGIILSEAFRQRLLAKSG